MTQALTDAAVRKLKPGTARRVIRDGAARSLYLVIQPSGHKSWMMRIRHPGGTPAKKIVLGPVDLSGKEVSGEPVRGMPLTLVGARQLAAQVHRDRAIGRDVISDHKVAKHRRRTEREEHSANTFAVAAKDFIAQHASKKVRRWQEQARLLGLRSEDLRLIPKGCAERWRDRPVAEIDSHDIHAIIDETRRLGAPGLQRRADGPTKSRARAMHACLSKMFSWLVQHRRVALNPCASVHRPEAAEARDRLLSDAEIAKFWTATDIVGAPFGAALKLLLLTGGRLNEVARMTRAELSDDLAIWSLPSARTKNRRSHIVPLAPLARAVLAGIDDNDCGLIFTSNGVTPISGWSKIKARLDTEMRIPPWRIHDLRRTAVTGMAEIGVAPHVIELVVNHVSGARAGVAGIYNRSELLAERRAALERWSQHVEGIVAIRRPLSRH